METSTTMSRITMRTWSRSGLNRPREGWTVSTPRAMALAGAGFRGASLMGSGGALSVLLAIGIDVEGLGALLGGFLVDHHLGDAAFTRQLVHRLQQDAFHDGTQAACPGFPLDGAASND